MTDNIKFIIASAYFWRNMVDMNKLFTLSYLNCAVLLAQW
jgi:hypothetical protein